MRPWIAAALVLAACGPPPDGRDVRWVRSLTFGADPVRLTVNLDADSLTAATTLQVELVLDAGSAIRARLPETIALSRLIPRASAPSPPEPTPEGGLRERVRLMLEPTLPGTAVIGPVIVEYEVEEGGQWVGRRLETDPIEITVASLGVPEEGPLQLRPPRGPAWPRTPVLPYLIAAVAGLAAVFAAVYWLTLRRTRRSAPLLPPDRLAMQEFAELERRNLLGRGELRRFYAELADVLRRYLDRAFAVPAPDLTTGETLLLLHGTGRLSRDSIASAHELLDEADLVKFAKHEPSIACATDRLLEARAFVRTTSTPEEPSDAV